MILRIRAAAGVCFLAASFLCAACGPRVGVDTGGWDEQRAAIDRRVIGLIDGGGFARALALADSLVAAGDRSSRVLGQRARALAGLGRGAEAIRTFEDAILADYENCENHLHFATYLMREGKTGRAHTEFMEAKLFCEQRYYPVIHRNLAVASIKLEKPGDAMRYVEEGLRSDPDDPYLLGLKGMLVAGERPALAESLFVRTLSSGDVSAEFLVQYGFLLLGTGRAADAVRAFERADAARPGDREIGIYLAQALERAGRFQEAESRLRRLLAEGDGPAVRELLARVLFRAGKYGESLELWRGLEETPEIMDRIAMCLHHLGRADEALAWARRALAAQPDWPQGMINLAVILASKGELAEAAGLLERALSLDPGNAAARINLERLRKARGEAGEPKGN